MTYIEQLLAKLEDVELREQFNGVLAKAPEIEQYIVDPETRQRADALTQWAETEWDYEHNMSRREYQQEQEIAVLTAKTINQKDSAMELNELNEHLGKYIKENGLMTKAEYEAGITAKETSFNQELNLVSTLATRIPYLNAKYQKDFGDVFDPDEFVTKANEKGYARFGKEGLDKFYDEFTADKRAAKAQAEMDAKIAEAREEGRKAALKETHMGPTGQMPTLDGSPEMGHFEAKLKGGNRAPAEGQTSAPPDAELGRGTIARFAALAADARDRAALVN